MNRNEHAYFNTLKVISTQFMTPDQLRRCSLKEYGLDYHEALEMAYENVITLAREAVKGKRRPKERT